MSTESPTTETTPDDSRDRYAEERIADIRTRCLCNRNVLPADFDPDPDCPIHGDPNRDLRGRYIEVLRNTWSTRPSWERQADAVLAVRDEEMERVRDDLVAEVDRLRTALEEVKLRTMQRDLSQIAKAALEGGEGQ